MKPLLNKTTKPFIIYVLIVLIISIPVYYFVVDFIWQEELDEHNTIVAEKTSYEFNKTHIGDDEVEQNIALWNKIQPGTNIEKISANQIKPDSVFTVEKYKPFSADKKIERYRCLRKVVYIKNVPYLFTIETNIEETEGTVMIIGLITGFFFILIVTGLFILNRRLSRTIWKPFRDTLEKLQKFNLNNQDKIDFLKTDTKEFEDLNDSLRKLIDHSVSVYATQKEFTENASHELQTPLAILKNKLDILLQSKDLTEKQYEIAEEMNRALTRSSRINKNLLLLAKIENNQFENSDMQLDELLMQCFEAIQEHFLQKNISATSTIHSNVRAFGNLALTEVLINNLLINAIRHTTNSGTIKIELNNKSFKVCNSGTQALNSDLLFKRFSRFSSDHNGSGLGLAIIKEICRFQHWEIEYAFENDFHIFSVKF